MRKPCIKSFLSVVCLFHHLRKTFIIKKAICLPEIFFCDFPEGFHIFYFFLCISEAVLFRMDFKRNFVFSCTGGNTQPSAALISGLHSCSVHSIRYADCCTGKPAASGNKSAAGRRHIALDLFVFLCSKIEFSPDSLACLQGNLQPFLRKKKRRLPVSEFSTQ